MPILKAFGMEIPISRSVLPLLGLAACAVVAGVAWRQWQTPTDVVTLREANAQLTASVSEYGRHLADDPEKVEKFYDDARGSLAVRMFSDGCIVLRWVDRDHHAATRFVRNIAHENSEPIASYELPLLTVPVAAAGRCLDQHPGPFRTWYGARKGDWVEVWRQWPDGCTHVQLLNIVTGAWDSYANGAARVTWTQCVH